MNTQLATYSDAENLSYELINGQEVMQAAASIPHLNIQWNLARIIGNYLRGKKCKALLEPKVIFDNDKNWFQPDLAITCNRNNIKLNHIQGAPDFVVEILSPTTATRDFTIKKDTYEQHGVKEYWIIDPKAENIFKYLLQDGKYELEGIFHNYTAEEWGGLTEAEKQEQQLTLKISLYDDLIIDIKEIFEE